MPEHLQHSRSLARAIALAPEEAHRFKHGEVEPYHLLLGMLVIRCSIAAQVVGSCLSGVDVLQLARQTVAKLRLSPETETALVDVKLSPSARQVVDSALALALARDAEWLGTEHLLEVLLRFTSDQDHTARILQELGLEPEQLRHQLGSCVTVAGP